MGMGGDAIFWVINLLFITQMLWKTESVSGFRNLEKSMSDRLRGVAIVNVVLCHLMGRLGYSAFLLPGYYSVAIFFFVSGYGLFVSLETKEWYLRGFLKNRLPAVYFPFLAINAIAVAFLLPSAGIMQRLSWLVGFELYDTTQWFILAILFQYISFYLFARLFSGYKLILLIVLSSCFWFFVHKWVIGSGGWWYMSIFNFPLGCLVAYRRALISEIATRRKVLFVAIFASIAILCIVLDLNRCIKGVSYVAPSFYVMGIFFIVGFRKAKADVLFTYIGAASMEVYLLHMKIMDAVFRADVRFGIISAISFVVGMFLAVFAFRLLASKMLNCYRNLFN